MSKVLVLAVLLPLFFKPLRIKKFRCLTLILWQCAAPLASHEQCCWDRMGFWFYRTLQCKVTVHWLCLAWSYPFSPLFVLHTESIEVRRVPFQGLRGLMHWDTNVLKRPRRWQWTTIIPRSKRKQVWLIFMSFFYIQNWPHHDDQR